MINRDPDRIRLCIEDVKSYDLHPCVRRIPGGYKSDDECVDEWSLLSIILSIIDETWDDFEFADDYLFDVWYPFEAIMEIERALNDPFYRYFWVDDAYFDEDDTLIITLTRYQS